MTDQIITYPLAGNIELRVYRAKWPTKCNICRKVFQEGEWIARMPDDLHSELRDLGIVKLKKAYAHVECLPEPMPIDLRDEVLEIAQSMMDLTDPRWPKDYRGFNKPDAGKVERWLNCKASPYGAATIARSLRKYFMTQLGGTGSPIVDSVNNAVKVTNRNRKKKQKAFFQHGAKKKTASSGQGLEQEDQTSSKSDPIPEPDQVHETTVDVSKGTPVEIDLGAYGGQGAMEGKDGVILSFDPPWTSEQCQQLKDRVKGYMGRFDPQRTSWWMSIDHIMKHWSDLFPQTEQWDIRMTEVAKQAIDSRLEELKEAAVTAEDVKRLLEGKLAPGLEPYPFQLEGIAFAQSREGRCLIGDPMGVGKTIQAMGWLAINPEDRPALIVVPSIVVKKWEKELAKWLPNEKVFRISKRKVVVPSDSTIVVTTYDLLKSTQGRMRKLKPKACVIDECHMIKNYKAQRTQAFLEFLDRTGISKIVALSGTPIVNRPAEFYTVLRILAPEEFPSWKYYTERYCGATWNGYGWDLKGATNTQELAERVRNVMIRRNKSEVLTDLPDKHRCHLPIELNRKELNEYRSAIHGEYSGKKTPTQAEHLASIAAARQWVAKRKAKEAIDFAKESYAQGEPLIIFAVHHATIETIVDGCRKAGMKVGQIDGRVSSSKREDIASSFQDGELDVVVLGIRSGGVGIDLFRGSNVLMVERGWTPGEEEQAEDRSHRNGQTNAVVVHYLHVEQTVDDMMDELIEKKRQVLNSVLDGGKNLDEGVDIRDELLVNWMEQYG